MMTFKTWDYRGVFKEDFEGDFEGDLEGDLEGSSSGQVRSRSGLVKVWFSLQPKFNSFELDSEVGRLVCIKDKTYVLTSSSRPIQAGLSTLK